MSIFEMIVYPFSQSLYLIADIFNGNYGAAIIVITFFIRIVLFPLFIKQGKQQKKMQAIMQAMKPELDELQKKYKNCTDLEEKRKQQVEMVELYKKHKINPLLMGCLPMLIQLPVVLGMYWAVIETSELSNHYFLWFNFTETSFFLAIVAGLIYYFQGKLGQDSASVTVQPNMRWMILLSPIIIFTVSLSSPAILPFYWSVNGLLLIVQSCILKKFIV